jgi:hypothetical protein
MSNASMQTLAHLPLPRESRIKCWRNRLNRGKRRTVRSVSLSASCSMTPIEGDCQMANREQRGNRETRKPKKAKAAKGAPPPAASPAPKPGQPVAWKQSPKKP